MCKDLESSPLPATSVAILRIKLLVLVTLLVMGGKFVYLLLTKLSVFQFGCKTATERKKREAMRH